MPTVPPTSVESKRLGDFEILRELGRGGMGIVYEARQVSLNRKVALKVLGGGLALAPKAIERFQREAEAAAKLHHTNIVPVYATGNQDGLYFYAMELIDGSSLDRIIKRLRESANAQPANAPVEPPTVADATSSLAATGPYTEKPPLSDPPAAGTLSSLNSGGAYFDTVASMIADVADALEHAHEQGVIHRDIKPSNLLLSASGRLSVNDFGLARVLEKPGMTVTGEFLGTPRYMSPEQITAGRIPIDRRTDIYSLGATLYELLTLQPPFVGEGRDQVLAQIVQKEPKPPRQVNPRVPVDLETICLKALEKDPDRRYQSARQMADDLRRFVQRYAIQARRAGPLERLGKWVRRHPAATGTVVCALIAAMLVSYFGYRASASARELQAIQCRIALDRTTRAAMAGRFLEAQQALAEARVLGASPGEIELWRGQIELYQGNVEQALVRLEEAVELEPDSVAARAVLAQAYSDAGQADKGWGRGLGMGKVQPKTAYDFLFLGRLRAMHDPGEAISLLSQAIELQDLPLARLIRAEIQGKYALMTGAPADAQLAVHDAEDVLRRLPKDPLALAAGLEAHLIASCVYEKKLPDKSRLELERCAELAAALKAEAPYGRALRANLLYLDHINDLDGVRAEYQRDPTAKAVTGRTYFFILYRHGKFDEALKLLEELPNTGNEAMYHIRKGFTLANMKDGPARALAQFREAWKIHKGRRDRITTLGPNILFLLGRREEAVGHYRHLLDTTEGVPWYNSAYEFWAERRTAEKLLEEAGQSRWMQCEAHYYIGIKRLSEGDRAAAREHFQKSVDARVLWYLEYEWSRALLGQMQDPAWPPWISNTNKGQ